ncbi:hypothetical protein SY83_09930 [Paenibacillus swuensis]|uniref:ChbG/HpnK family deacetylase n=1 Tax=Paenibacillus swuensis TaxID=1178515 RepID=A0A172THL1_9BACL|nr:polysaccharide deacetylase family protein [Paenibacillus swuensis]ANE46545.1 hypothetical protein SY83_09930 [Paenibacillus swuensis]
MSKQRILIINCDDFGQSAATNQAIMHLLEEGKVSSATIMVPAPGFEEAAAWCRRRNQPNIGLHLTLTSEFEAIRWRSLTGHPSLHGEDGTMHRTCEAFERRADAGAVMRELEAQYRLLAGYGFPVSHADNHMGSLYGVATGRSFIPQVLWKCARWGLPFRLFRKIDPSDTLLAGIPGAEGAVAKASALAGVLGVAIPDYLLSHTFGIEEGETYESFKQMMITKMYNLPEGISETYIHPGVENPVMQRSIPHWAKRVWEYRLLLEDDFTYAIQDAGVTLANYGHVAKYGRSSRWQSASSLMRGLLKK